MYSCRIQTVFRLNTNCIQPECKLYTAGIQVNSNFSAKIQLSFDTRKFMDNYSCTPPTESICISSLHTFLFVFSLYYVIGNTFLCLTFYSLYSIQYSIHPALETWISLMFGTVSTFRGCKFTKKYSTANKVLGKSLFNDNER